MCYEFGHWFTKARPAAKVRPETPPTEQPAQPSAPTVQPAPPVAATPPVKPRETAPA
jgi:hypothetical protein